MRLAKNILKTDKLFLINLILVLLIRSKVKNKKYRSNLKKKHVYYDTTSDDESLYDEIHSNHRIRNNRVYEIEDHDLNNKKKHGKFKGKYDTDEIYKKKNENKYRKKHKKINEDNEDSIETSIYDSLDSITDESLEYDNTDDYNSEDTTEYY